MRKQRTNVTKEMKANKEHDDDALERKILIEAAKKGSRRGREASLAMGLTVMSIEEGYIIETLPNGETRRLKKLPVPPPLTRGIKKGTILHPR